MPSSFTRLQTVTHALALAGRDMQIRTLAEDLLNLVLRQMALEYKYPILRKVGAPITLSAGASTAALPTDFGAGTDNLLFGDERIPMYELAMDEFVQAGGFPGASAASGKPQRYILDQEAEVFRFNVAADQAYTFVPIYYKCPANLGSGDVAYDDQYLWMPSDDVNVQGLVWKIYQFTGDPREPQQAAIWEALKQQYRRGSVPLGGGVSRIALSRQTFKPRRF